MTAKCSMCNGKGIVTAQTICDCKKLLEPPPARDWKPVVGEKVLVEATVTHDKWHRDTVLLAVGDYMNIKVPLSSIRPMTRKEGE